MIANINPREHGFVSKTQTLINANINEFTVYYSANSLLHIFHVCHKSFTTQSCIKHVK